MTRLHDELQAEAVEGLAPSEPVVMLNLMKFRERSLDGRGSGWDAYRRYSAHIAPLLKAVGGTILWTGEVQAVALGQLAQGDWDYAALVWYPKPAAFLDMVTSAEYQKGNLDRENGTERHLIMATHEKYSKFAQKKN